MRHRVIGRKHDDAQLWSLVTHLAQQRHPVLTGHRQIKHQHVNTALAHHLHGLLAVFGIANER